LRIATSAFGDNGDLPKSVIGLLGGSGSRRKGSTGKKRSKKQVANAIGAHGSNPREMYVMKRVIRAQCVQTLVRRNNEESSHRLKHIKVNLVPA
jgi:hypothetical protein